MTHLRSDSAFVGWKENRTPYSEKFKDIYYAEEDGLRESNYVFLAQNGLPSRWKETSSFCIGELGFGTALNFLATWTAWAQTSTQGQWLHYVSCEQDLMKPEQMEFALSRWPELEKYLKVFLEKYPPVVPTGFQRLHFPNDRISLSLLIGDARQTLRSLRGKIDAWYFDGFSPAKNPELWELPLFKEVGRLSHSQTTFSTYASAGFVRRNLEQVGFHVEKTPGFGRKRQMCRGQYKFGQPREDSTKASVSIIGGGLAGTAAAYHLAVRGHPVTLWEREHKIAFGASHHQAAVAFPLLSAQPMPLSRFTERAFSYLQQHLDSNVNYDLCGMLLFAESQNEEARFQRALTHRPYPSYAQFVTKAEASALAGTQVSWPAVHFPYSGWVNTKSLCERQVSLSNIEVRSLSAVHKIEQQQGQWVCLDDAHQMLQKADICIIANAYECHQFEELKWLPLEKVRGQSLGVQSQRSTDSLRKVLCHHGYVTPAIDGQHFIGGTFDRNDHSLAIRDHENKQMKENLNRITSEIDWVSCATNESHVRLRTRAPGNLPFIGPAKSATGKRLSNLYLSVGHGSRGLLTTTLGGEYLASLIRDEPWDAELPSLSS